MEKRIRIRKIAVAVICFALALSFMITGNINAAPKGYGFTYKGVTVYMNDKADKLLKKAGSAGKKSESKSCAYDGMDRTYTYKNFIIKTYSNSDKGTEYVNSIELLNSKVKTKEGIKVGSSKNDVVKKYGKATPRLGVYTYTKGKCRLLIEMDSKDKVKKITYLAK